MFKLLIEDDKQKVEHEYVVRRAIIILSASTIVFFVGVIGLLPSYILSSIRYNEIVEQTTTANNLSPKENEKELKAWLLETNRRLTFLSPKLDTDRPSSFIDKILELRTSNMKLTGFSWKKDGDNIALSINGIAPDRQALVELENRIKTSEYFSNVTLPISDLAKDKNINFQIKFSLL